MRAEHHRANACDPRPSMGRCFLQICLPHFFKTKIVINPNQVTVIFGVTGWAIWDPGVSLALASSR
ncbi:hypothetical protein THAOC_06832, partial [Thalassiosira oceanica]